MKKDKIITIAAATGLAATNPLLAAAGILAWKGFQKLKRQLKLPFNNTANLDDCQRAVFRIIAWDDNSDVFASGTAFLINANGFIISLYSIIYGCTKFAVAVRDAKTGKPIWLMATPIRVDPVNNLAVLFLSQQDSVLPTPLQIAQKLPNVRDEVLTMGFPCMSWAFIDGGGLDVNRDANFVPSTAKGMIDKVFATHIEHGAQLEHGNCGEPVIAKHTGEIVGVNSYASLNDGRYCPYTVSAKSIWDLINEESGMSYKEYLASYAQTRQKPLDIQKDLPKYQRAVFRIIVWQNNRPAYAGTSFLVRTDGQIITNYHVIENGEKFEVLMANPETGEIDHVKAKPLRVDPFRDKDLALLRLLDVDFPLPTPLSLSQTNPHELDEVVALGFPGVSDDFFNDYSLSLTSDEYIKPHTTKGEVNMIIASRIVHGAKIARGNSGGPLVSINTGEVIGVNTNICEDLGHDYSYAVPAQYIWDLINEECGMSYEEYLAWHPMNKRAAESIFLHLDFLTAKALGVAAKEIYADKLTNKSKNLTITRAQFENAVIKLDEDWPIRRYHLVSAKRSGNSLEALCEYNRTSSKGIEEQGYAMITLLLRGDLIVAFSEKLSDSPIKHTSSFKKIEYIFERDFSQSK